MGAANVAPGSWKQPSWVRYRWLPPRMEASIASRSPTRPDCRPGGAGRHRENDDNQRDGSGHELGICLLVSLVTLGDHQHVAVGVGDTHLGAWPG